MKRLLDTSEISPSRSALPEGYAEVTQGEWKSSQVEGKPLGTLSVSSCALVVIDNPSMKRAYMGHSFSPHSTGIGSKEKFDAMIDKIKKAEGEDQELYAWLSGTTLSDHEDEELREIHNEGSYADRGYVHSRLNEFMDEDSIHPDWLGIEEELSIMVFDPDIAQSDFIKVPIKAVNQSEKS